MGLYFTDKYSLLHFAVGIVMYYWGFSFLWTAIIHIIFELFENTKPGMHIINMYIPFWPGGKNSPDSELNSIGDTFYTCIGWLLSYIVFNNN
jgi:hypothetical protein